MKRAYPIVPSPAPDAFADLRRAAGWGLAAGGALVLQHFALWSQAKRFGGFNRWPPYVVGTATLGAALTGYAWQTRQARAAGAFWVIALFGGVAVVGAYRVHAAWTGPLPKGGQGVGTADPAPAQPTGPVAARPRRRA